MATILVEVFDQNLKNVSWNLKYFGQNIKGFGQNIKNVGQKINDFDTNLKSFGQTLKGFGQNIKYFRQNPKNCDLNLKGFWSKSQRIRSRYQISWTKSPMCWTLSASVLEFIAKNPSILFQIE